MSDKCSKCGFAVGDRVKMTSALTPMDGSPPAVVRGAVEDWRGGCHIIVWPSAAGTVTALPNPNVSIDEGVS